MQIQTAVFLTSSAHHTECPTANKPEVAFIGRSNVGKSSLINMLVGKKQLAKTSVTPGKTQLINHYLINQSYHFVDLPGYGWAQASKKKRQDWFTMTNQYLLHRPNIACLFVLLDIRLPPQPIDLDFMAWLKQHQIPFSIILTKSDKLPKYQVAQQLQGLEQMLAQQQQEPLAPIVTSSKDKIGREVLLNFIEKVMLQGRATSI